MTEKKTNHKPPAELPILLLTQGDVAGVGPEIIIRALAEKSIYDFCRPLVLGHPQILHRAASLLQISTNIVGYAADQNLAAALQKTPPSPNQVLVLQIGDDALLQTSPGVPSAITGQAAYEAILHAVKLVQNNEADGIVTAPLCKSALHEAGHTKYPGHTELLAELCGVQDFAMMLYLPPSPMVKNRHGLGVVHVTLHTPLKNIFSEITSAAILEKIHLADRFCRQGCHLIQPRIGVCALNPHGGESGLFGEEEITTIRPAVEAAQKAGLQVTGPLPTDTLMISARDGMFDAVVAMYHDQGHIALKLLGIHQAVNITLGLPIVRTSVAHGTAFDKAWKGTAESAGMLAALRVAANLVHSK